MSGLPPGESWEERLRDAAAGFEYPPTPDIAGAVRQRLRSKRMAARPVVASAHPSWRRRWVVVAVALAIMLLGLFAVPGARAALIDFLRIGAIRVVLPTATPPAPAPTATLVAAAPARAPTASPRPTGRPLPTPTVIGTVLNLAGETTLDELRRHLPLKLPAYPDNLGPPDRVFLQDWDGPVGVLVWLKPDQPEQIRWSLHLLTSGQMARKFANENTLIEETEVNGRRALWMRGPHLLELYERATGDRGGRMVVGDVLIWTEDNRTYRLETPGDVPLAEAVKIAESLR